MTQLEALYLRLELASFSQRQQIADEVARDTGGDVSQFVRGLDHPNVAVRLGVVEILRRARYRAALRELHLHALAHDGDDRVFTVRALAELAEPGDTFLAEAARAWATSGDPYLEPHGAKLVATLRTQPTPAPAEPATAAASGDTLEKLVRDLFTAVKGADRIALVEQIERRGPVALVAAAKLVFQKGNDNLVAYMCRAVIRNAAQLSAPAALVPLLERARLRIGEAPIAEAAIDDALVALGGLTLSPSLLSRVVDMDRTQLDELVMRLTDADAKEVALHIPTLLDAIAQRPSLWASLGPAFVYAAPYLRESARIDLRRLCELVVDDLRKGTSLPPLTVVSTAWVLARIAEQGEPLSHHLRRALERISVSESSTALVALCGRLASEEAARILLRVLRDPLPEATAAARAQIATWQSPWVRIENDAIITQYVDDTGQPLTMRGGKLVITISGEELVLDHRGRPVRAGDTEWGGCLCCSPGHALIKRRGHGLRCPASWESHLREGGRTTFEKDHALGRCVRCDSIRPRVRDGARVICLDCGHGLQDDEILIPPPSHPPVPSEHGRGDNDAALPKPPTRDELEHVAHDIRSAILANVYIRGRDGDDRWNGSGIVIARDGNYIAILTNRHVVESDDRARLAALEAMTVTGEAIRPSCLWRATRGIDLALIEGYVSKPDAVGIASIGAGTGKVGAEVFAIGNPLGLAWSYSAGTLGAVRHWTTTEGLSVKILQTDANIAPGSSGGGLFHRDGHLLGVISFLAQGASGGSAHFALSIDAVRGAFARENVTWRGRRLADLP
ncbi:MAG: trypsin-like peptidase domain-containing protein [Kofleriaceae bacterium]